MSKKNNIEPEITSTQKFDIPELVHFSLLENAMDSIEQGLGDFYLAEKNHNKRDYKHCLLNLFQGAELLLKSILSRIDEKLVFETHSLKKKCIDPANPTRQELYLCSSVKINDLTSLIKKHYPNNFKIEGLSLVTTLGIERNKIQHFAIEIDPRQLARMLRELYFHVFKPAFQLIVIDEGELRSFDSSLKAKIVDFEAQFLDINIEHEYTLSLCPSCESWSHFIIYRGESFPVESYCMCCDFKLSDLESCNHELCPECGAPSVIYIPERQAGACLWHKCYYSKEGGFVPMEPCQCGGYKMEGRCERCDEED
ncbi:hypothetical protein ACET65_21700 [Aeromonas rivipollensis]